MTPMRTVARELGLEEHEILPWGEGAAKLTPDASFSDGPLVAPLVLVSAMSPTPAGEGKTTTVIGLTEAARLRGLRSVCALRQPSLGPVFGRKGGGAGGGFAELVPAHRVNLHLTGDLHAVAAAHNLLAALVDNELHFHERHELDPRRVALRRVIDINDRALREIVVGLGGAAHGVPRPSSFEITAASEVMAVLSLASGFADLKRRLGDILVGDDVRGAPVYARDLGASGAMAALLRDALLPNLVQTTAGAPALVHGGPFANIAHGTSSVVAARVAMRRAEIVFTEAGFGFDLGGEKFLDIVCRTGGFWPRVVVLVATLRALRFHGATSPERADAQGDLLRGLANLDRHVESVRRFGLEPIVALNVRAEDSAADLALVTEELGERGISSATADPFGRGGEGCIELVDRVVEKARGEPRAPRFLYAPDDTPEAKIRAVATAVYGAADVRFAPAAAESIAGAVAAGHGGLAVCIAKTHLSLSDDEKRHGRPEGFTLTVREVRVAAGAGFLVALTGDIVTMPGLPRVPRAADIDLLPDGTIVGVR